MRKVLLALLAMMMVLLVGCGKKEICTVDGCTQEVYKDGLCADHYVEEAMATPAPTTTPEPTIVDGLKDGYQEYIDAAIECVRSSLKNPKQRFTRGYKRYKETSGLIDWKECQIFHSIFT